MHNESRQNLDFLSVQYRALMTVGIDIGTLKGKNFIKNLPKWSFYLSITIYLQIALIVFAGHLITEQVEKASAALSMFNQASLLLFKIGTLKWKADRLLKFIWDMNLLATKANKAENEEWLSQNRISKVIANIYSTACIASVILSAVVPIIFMSYEYFNGLEVHLKLPFDGEFPYERLGVPIFILNYILSLIYVFCLLGLTIGIDTLFGWLIFAISGHFRIVRLKVEVAARKIVMYDNHADFRRDMSSIVHYHNKVLYFVDEINSIFGLVFCGEVFMSCLQMCFILYTVNNETDKTVLPFNITVFVAITIQVMIYCFGGEKIKTENDMLCDDIYMKFPWEKMFPFEKKFMLMPLMRSQRNASLDAIFFEMDRNLLVYIYRSAFSFNTLLGGMKE